MVFVAAALPSMGVEPEREAEYNQEQQSLDQATNSNDFPSPRSPQSPISNSSEIRRSSTSSIISPFDPSSPGKKLPPGATQPLSLAFLKKKRRSSEPMVEIPTPSSGMSSPLVSELRLVRKKSGELVKSSLKLNQLANNNSKSMPNTPIFKNVHFGQDVDVRYFDEAEKPSAVSAQNSPTLRGAGRRRVEDWGNGAVFDFSKYAHGNYDDDDDDDEEEEEEENNCEDWEMKIVNFDKIKYNEKFANKSKIFLEVISLNDDRDSIVGAIAVKNLSYQKNVHLRYTFDNWKTVIEISCSFETDLKNVPRILKRNNYDRFKFQLDLKNFKFLVNKSKLDSPTTINLKFCIRYRFENSEIWDNNSFKNYEINLIHKRIPRHDKFSLNDINEYNGAPPPKSATSTVPPAGTDYFSFKKHHEYDFSAPSPQFGSNRQFIAGINSPDTPKVLKFSDNYKNREPDEEISLDPILKDLDTFTDLKDPTSKLDQFNKFSDGVNKLTILDDGNDRNIPLFNYVFNYENDTAPLVFGNKPMTGNSTDRTNTNEDLGAGTGAGTGTGTGTGASVAPSTKPLMNSKSYQELIDAYCFFKGNDTDQLNPNIRLVDTHFNPQTDENANPAGQSLQKSTSGAKQQTSPSTNKRTRAPPSTVSEFLGNI